MGIKKVLGRNSMEANEREEILPASFAIICPKIWAQAENLELSKYSFKKEKRRASKVSERNIKTRGRKTRFVNGERRLMFPKNKDEIGIVRI